MVGSTHAARSGHVLHDDPRLPRDVPAEMVGDHAGIEIKAASRRIAGDQRDHAVLVEILDPICMRGQRQARSEEKAAQDVQTGNAHCRAPRTSSGFGTCRIGLTSKTRAKAMLGTEISALKMLGTEDLGAEAGGLN